MIPSHSSHVIQAHYIDTAVLERVAYRVTEDSRSQVPDMHLLGHVGRREVDDGALAGQPGGPCGDSVDEHGVDTLRDVIPGDLDVDETLREDEGQEKIKVG